MSLLSLDNVSLSRSGVTLLEGLSLDIAPGAIVWIRGANGTGKSTLLRVLAGFLAPSSGRVAHAQQGQPDIAYVGHADGFDDRARLSSIASIWSLPEARVRSITGVEDLSSRRVFELSAGQRRKLSLLRLLVCKRSLWLLDEPYASLDAIARETLTAEIIGHVRCGGAAVIVSHADLPELGRRIQLLELRDPS